MIYALAAIAALIILLLFVQRELRRVKDKRGRALRKLKKSQRERKIVSRLNRKLFRKWQDEKRGVNDEILDAEFIG